MLEPTPENAKVQSLEGLRGLMAWWVVVGHISAAFGWSLGLLNRNTLAVDVFVLLSGFVIARLIVVKGEPYPRYIVRRAFRLFPLYLVALAISAWLLPIQLEGWTALAPTPQNASRIDLAESAIGNLPAHLLFHIPLAQGLVPISYIPNAAFTIIGQAWSISLEMQFYILAPLLVLAASRPRYWLLGVAIISTLLAISPFFSGAFLGGRIIHFALGMATWFAVGRAQPRPLALAVIAAMALAIILRDGKVQVIPLGIWAVVIAAAVGRARNLLSPIAITLSSRLAVHHGEISYSIYLLHMIPLFVSITGFHRAGLQGVPLAAAVTLATLGATYLLARYAHRWIEKPGIRLGARVAGNLAHPSSPAAARA